MKGYTPYGAGLAIGMVLSIAIGAVFDKVGLGLALGIVFGAAFAGIASRRMPPNDP